MEHGDIEIAMEADPDFKIDTVNGARSDKEIAVWDLSINRNMGDGPTQTDIGEF